MRSKLALFFILLFSTAFLLTGCASTEITQIQTNTTIELGSACTLNITDYFELGSKVKTEDIILDTSSVNTNTVGSYEATVTYKKNTYIINVSVIDTTAPIVTAKTDMEPVELGTTIKASDYVEVTDLSDYTVCFVTDDGETETIDIPSDYREGKFEIAIIAVDTQNNRSDIIELYIYLSVREMPNTEHWSEAYQYVVDGWQSDMGEDSLGYEFIYLDDDDIPELVMHCYDKAWEGFDIYTYCDGKAVHLDRYDMYGECEMERYDLLTSNGRQTKADSYISKSGIVFQRGGMMGCYWINGYKLENNGKLKQIISYAYIDTTDWTEDPGPISYELEYKKKDGTIVSWYKEEDVEFEDIVELPEIESEYTFLYNNRISISFDDPLMTYDEVVDYLKEKRFDFDRIE